LYLIIGEELATLIAMELLLRVRVSKLSVEGVAVGALPTLQTQAEIALFCADQNTEGAQDHFLARTACEVAHVGHTPLHWILIEFQIVIQRATQRLNVGCPWASLSCHRTPHT